MFESVQLADLEESQVQEVTAPLNIFPRPISRYFVMQSDVFDSAGSKVIVLVEGQAFFVGPSSFVTYKRSFLRTRLENALVICFRHFHLIVICCKMALSPT